MVGKSAEERWYLSRRHRNSWDFNEGTYGHLLVHIGRELHGQGRNGSETDSAAMRADISTIVNNLLMELLVLTETTGPNLTDHYRQEFHLGKIIPSCCLRFRSQHHRKISNRYKLNQPYKRHAKRYPCKSSIRMKHN